MQSKFLCARDVRRDVRRPTSNIRTKEMQWLLGEKYQGRLTSVAKRDIARLQKGEHIDYVIGSVDFLGCKIDLSKKPFIPRPETEYWVERAIQDIRSHCVFSSRFIPPAGGSPTRLGRKRSARPSIRCLDLFAGSGCIGVAILKYVPGATVDFAEENKTLLSQIEKNALLNKISKTRYRVIQSDIFSNIKGTYDYIFANPPYIAESRKGRVQASVLKNEPAGALFAGRDGLWYIKRFLKEAKNYLNPAGKIYTEFDSFQKPAIQKLLKEYGYSSWEFCKDQYGRWRFLTAHCS